MGGYLGGQDPSKKQYWLNVLSSGINKYSFPKGSRPTGDPPGLQKSRAAILICKAGIDIYREEHAESIGFQWDPDQQGTSPDLPNVRAGIQNAKLCRSASIGKAWGGPLMVKIPAKNNTC